MDNRTANLIAFNTMMVQRRKLQRLYSGEVEQVCAKCAVGEVHPVEQCESVEEDARQDSE